MGIPSSSDESSQRGTLRIRRATLTGITAILVRGTTTIASLLTLPITAQYLGAEEFGVWLTLGMLLNWVNLTDLGLSSSLTNVLATAEAQTDDQKAKQAVASAFWMSVAVAIVLSITFAIASPHLAWEHLFNVRSEQTKQHLNLAVLLFFVGFVLRLPLSIARQIYTAYQAGYFYQFWGGISMLMSLLALLLAIQFHVGLPFLVGAFFGASLLGDVLSTLHVFGWKWKSLCPRWSHFNFEQAKDLLRVGFQFWIVQIVGIILFQTDLIIVAQLFSASEVAVYGTVLKLFTLLGTIQTSFLFPLWSAYSEALARNDRAWIVRTFRKTFRFSLLWSLFGGTALAIACQWIVRSWLHQPTLELDRFLVVSMVFTTISLALGHCIGTCLNGIGEIKIQVVFGFAAAVTNIVLSIALGKFLGVSGVCISTAISLLIFSLGIMGYHLSTIFQRYQVFTHDR